MDNGQEDVHRQCIIFRGGKISHPLVILGPAQCDNGSCHLPHAPVTQQLSPLDLAYPLPPSPTFPYFGAAREHGRTILYKVREGIGIEKKKEKYKYLLQFNNCFIAYPLKYASSLQTLSYYRWVLPKKTTPLLSQGRVLLI